MGTNYHDAHCNVLEICGKALPSCFFFVSLHLGVADTFISTLDVKCLCSQ
jgi:hypothetical protein